MRGRLVGVVVLCACFIAGCYPGKEEASRYPSVAIPGYTAMDYGALTMEPDPEIVYNAVANLADGAGALAKTLSEEGADPSSVAYRNAAKIYARIRELASSRDARVQAASLRFLQLFAVEYARKGELIALAAATRPRSAQASCEKAELLRRVTPPGGYIDDGVVRSLADNRSWLVSRMAYGLIDSLRSDALRDIAIERYQHTERAFERLLALGALRTGYSDRVLAFLVSELRASPDHRIRRAILDALDGAQDKELALKWVAAHFSDLRPADREYLVARSAESMSGYFPSRVLVVAVKAGHVPDDKFYAALYDRLYALQNDKQRTPAQEAELLNLRSLEAAVDAQPISGAILRAYRERRDAAERVDPALEAAFLEAAERVRGRIGPEVAAFRDEVNALFASHGLDAESRKRFVDATDDDILRYILEAEKER